MMHGSSFLLVISHGLLRFVRKFSLFLPFLSCGASAEADDDEIDDLLVMVKGKGKAMG